MALPERVMALPKRVMALPKRVMSLHKRVMALPERVMALPEATAEHKNAPARKCSSELGTGSNGGVTLGMLRARGDGRA